MPILNCTPHAIVLRTPNGDVTFPPSGITPRLASSEVPVVLGGGMPLPCVKNVFGAVENLPTSEDGTYLIVSTLIAQACPDRADLIAPDTGRTAIREDGQVKAVIRFQSFAIAK